MVSWLVRCAARSRAARTRAQDWPRAWRQERAAAVIHSREAEIWQRAELVSERENYFFWVASGAAFFAGNECPQLPKVGLVFRNNFRKAVAPLSSDQALQLLLAVLRMVGE